jgi:beta-glucosidase/6-phospho-beta-glucosidase/beta-galactosidase
MAAMRRTLALALSLAAAGCGDDAANTDPVSFGTMGPLVGDAGKGSWRFGAASASAQIEDMNIHTDWWAYTSPTSMGGLGKLTFVGDATKGYTLVNDDLGIVRDLGIDSYRFSIEWARIEPQRDVIDEAAIAHYRAELESLKAMGVRPLVTLHHFSNPVWTADPRDITCASGPTDTNLCGFGSPGGAQIVEEMGEHAKLLAERFGDIVDEWGTVNEPVIWMIAAYGVGTFPPAKVTLSNINEVLIPGLRDYLAAQAAIYHALKDNDTIDADGDGSAAAVGFSMSVADWEPARSNKPSTNPDDIAARDRLVYILHYAFVDAAINGTFDSDLDGTADEQHPEWKNTIDWLGLQYYFRAGVSGDAPLLAGVKPCIYGIDLGACLPAPEPSYCAPIMGYEAWNDGFAIVIRDFAKRYPTMPLVVTESGIATKNGKRRAENIVRILEAVTRVRDEGVDLRGYYHWSLTDNFEWAEGFGPRFGLYTVDYSTYGRSPTEGATVYKDIVAGRTLTTEQRKTYGGIGPMSPEPGWTEDPYCTKVPE